MQRRIRLGKILNLSKIGTSGAYELNEATSQHPRPSTKSLGSDEARLSEAVDGGTQILLTDGAHPASHGSEAEKLK